MPVVFHFFLTLIMIGFCGLVSAEIAYEYRTPKGVTIFTDVKLSSPFKLIRKVQLKQKDDSRRNSYAEYVKEKQQEYDYIIRIMAAKYSLPPELVHAIIEAESGYTPDAISSAGAVGMMQLMPETARRFGVSDLTNVTENIEGGTRYMRYLLDLHESDLTLAIASYNAGESAVKRYNNQIPPYPETQNYVTKVLGFFKRNL